MIKKILQLCTRSRGSTAASFHVAFKEPLHFMKRAVISWPALVIWTAVFLCLFFLFQQAGEDKHTRVGNHAYIHSRSMTWTLDTANEWLVPIKLNWWVIKSCSNQKLVSVFCRAAWYCYRVLCRPAWAAKQPPFPLFFEGENQICCPLSQGLTEGSIKSEALVQQCTIHVNGIWRETDKWNTKTPDI